MSKRSNKEKKNSSAWEIALAIVLSVLMALGYTISVTPNDKSVVGVIRDNMTSSILCCFLLSIGCLICVRYIFGKLDERNRQCIAIDRGITADGKMPSTKYCLKVIATIFICWLPYLIICFPAITRGYDYFWQLLQGMGVFPLSNHHPILGSIVYGLLFRVGNLFGGATGGLFVTVLFQTLLLAASVGFSFSFITHVSCVSKWLKIVLLAYICLCPIFPGHAAWLVKDTIFSAIAVFLFTQIYIRVWSERRAFRIPKVASLPALAISATFFSLYRNGVTAIVVMLFAMIALSSAWSNRKNKSSRKLWQTAAATLSVIVVLSIWDVATDKMGVFPTNAREAFSLPTRQIIRTVQLHPEELQENDSAILFRAYHDQFEAGTAIEDIVARYDDYNADYIKLDYVEDADFVKDYLTYWVDLGLRHPGSYVDALLRGTDGYWYIGKHPHLEAQGVVIHTVCTVGVEDDFANEPMQNRNLDSLFLPTVKSLERAGVDTGLTFRDYFGQYPWLEDLMNSRSAFPKARTALGDILADLENIPILNMVLSPGLYFTIMLVALVYVISRRKTGAHLWPILLIEAIAFLSPVNGYTRYVLPVELMSIIMVGMCFEPDEKRMTSSNL